MDPATAESVSDSASWVHCRLRRMWKSVRLRFNPVAMLIMVEVGDRFWHFVLDQPQASAATVCVRPVSARWFE